MKHLLIFCFSLFSVIAVGQIRPDQFTEDRSPVGADAFYTQETVGGIPTPRKIRIDTLRNWMITSGNIVDRVELLDSLTAAAANNDSLYIVASQTSLVGISSPAQNDIALNTAKDTFFIRDGASWVAVPIGGGSGGVYVAETQNDLTDPNLGLVFNTSDSTLRIKDHALDDNDLVPIQKQRIVATVADLDSVKAPLNAIFKVEETGAEYVLQADSVLNYVTDGVAVRQNGDNYFVLNRQGGTVYARWFNAIVNDGLPDDDAFQSAVDFCVTSGASKIVTDAGDYNFEKGFVIQDLTSGSYNFVSLTIEGPSYGYALLNKEDTRFLVDDGNTFGIGIQLGRNVQINNIVFQGQASGPGTFKALVEGHDWTNGGAARDNQYSPHAAIVIDPFGSTVAGGNQYPDWAGTSYSLQSGIGGSSMVKFEGCSFTQFITDIMVSPNGATANCDNIKAENCRSGVSKTFWATGQSQSRGNSIENCYNVGLMETYIDCINFGNGIGTSPTVVTSNLAGGIKRLFLAGGGFNTINFTDTYIESLWMIGNARIDKTTKFSGTTVKFHIPAANEFLPAAVFEGGPFVMEGGSLEYFTNCVDVLPFPFHTTRTPVFKGVHIQGGLVIRNYGNAPGEKVDDFIYDAVDYKCSADLLITNTYTQLNTDYKYSLPNSTQLRGAPVLGSNSGFSQVDFSSSRGADIHVQAPNYEVFFIGSQALTVDSSNQTGYFITSSPYNGISKIGDVVLSTHANPGIIEGFATTFRAPIGTVESLSGDTVFVNGITYNHTTVSQSMHVVRIPTFAWAYWGDVETGNDTISNLVWANNYQPLVGQTISIAQNNIPFRNGTYIKEVNTVDSFIVASSPSTQNVSEYEFISVPYRVERIQNANTIWGGVPHHKGDESINNGYTPANDDIIKWVCTKGGIVGSGIEPVYVAVTGGTIEWENNSGTLQPVTAPSDFNVEVPGGGLLNNNLSNTWNDFIVYSQSSNASIYSNISGSTQNTYYKPSSSGFGTTQAAGTVRYGSFRDAGGAEVKMNYSTNGAAAGYEILYNNSRVAYYDTNKDLSMPNLANSFLVGANNAGGKLYGLSLVETRDTLGIAIVDDGDGTASTASGIGRVDFLDTIAVARDHGLQIGATGDTPTGIIKYELSSNYLKGYGTADWNIGSETNGIAFHVDNNNRNIGIRTAIPSEALEVNGNAKADSVFIDEVNVQRLGTDANGKIVAKEFWSNQIVQNSNSPYTGTESITDYQINGASGAVTLELPQGTNMRGRVVYLMRTDDNPLETITINTASGAIRGSADVGAEIANRYSSVTLRSNGTDWWVTAINNN